MSRTGSLKQWRFRSSPFWSSGSKARCQLHWVSLRSLSPGSVCSRAGLCMHNLGVSLQFHGVVSACAPSASPCRFTGWSLHAHPRRLPVVSRGGLCMYTLGVSLQIQGLVLGYTFLVSPCGSSSVLLLRTPIRLNQDLPWWSHFNLMILLNGLSTNTFTF